jgi:hypothetical protein
MYSARPKQGSASGSNAQGDAFFTQRLGQLLAVPQPVLQAERQAVYWQASSQLPGYATRLPRLDQNQSEAYSTAICRVICGFYRVAKTFFIAGNQANSLALQG